MYDDRTKPGRPSKAACIENEGDRGDRGGMTLRNRRAGRCRRRKRSGSNRLPPASKTFLPEVPASADHRRLCSTVTATATSTTTSVTATDGARTATRVAVLGRPIRHITTEADSLKGGGCSARVPQRRSSIPSTAARSAPIADHVADRRQARRRSTWGACAFACRSRCGIGIASYTAGGLGF